MPMKQRDLYIMLRVIVRPNGINISSLINTIRTNNPTWGEIAVSRHGV